MYAATPWSPWEALGPNPGPRAPETPRLTAGRDPPKRHLGHLGRCGGGVALEELWGVPLVFGASVRQAGVSEPPRTRSWRIKLVPLRSVKSIMQLMVQTKSVGVGCRHFRSGTWECCIARPQGVYRKGACRWAVLKHT